MFKGMQKKEKLGIERLFGKTEIKIQSKEQLWGKFEKLKKYRIGKLGNSINRRNWEKVDFPPPRDPRKNPARRGVILIV